ncbi:MAG: hypothetical protein HXY40_08810 [Chloroflexi bacterium]|nr:hypothetical protein [Chloroflexota bacterium]
MINRFIRLFGFGAHHTLQGFTLLWLACILLAACGAGGTTANTTSAPQPTADMAVASAEVSGLLIYYRYNVEFSGGASGRYTGIANNIFRPAAATIVSQMSLANPDETLTAYVSIPITADVGEHPIVIGGAQYWVNIYDTSKTDPSFSLNPTGSVTIESVAPLRLNFSFTSENAAGERIAAAGTVEELPHSFEVVVTGDTELTMPPGSATLYNGTLILNAANPMEFPSNQYAFRISLELPDSVAPGTYALVGSGDEATAEQIVANVVDLADTGGSTYSVNLEGTLTLTETGEQLTGSFTLSAQTAEGKTLTASGSFENIYYPSAEVVD